MFYKQVNGGVQAASEIHTPDLELNEETHGDYTYPIDGWRWFDTFETAMNYFSTPENSVTSLQGMLAIEAAGLVTPFNAWLATLDDVTDFTTLAYFQRAQIWKRDDPTLLGACAVLGLDDAQLDGLFALAKTL